MVDTTTLKDRWLQLEYRLEYLREEFMWDRACSYRELAQKLREQAAVVDSIINTASAEIAKDTLCRFCDDYMEAPQHNPQTRNFTHGFNESEACRPRR